MANADASPIALTIAGSDSSGGAGIQADLKTFTVFGVYGASVLTALTAQNTRGVTAIHAVPPEFVAQQIDAVAADLKVGATKTGMLNDRATGMFKDPNVYGAFLVFPALIALTRVITGDFAQATRGSLLLALFAGAILLSFSRAAWGQVVLTAILVLILTFVTCRSPSLQLRIVIRRDRDLAGTDAVRVLDLELAMAQLGVIAVAQDRKQPRLQVAPGLELLAIRPGLEHRVLHQVVGAGRVAAQRAAEGAQRRQ